MRDRQLYRTEPQGKYDDIAERLLLETGAAIVSVCVISGKRGNGFSLTADLDRPEMSIAIHRLPELLREVADGIDADIERIKALKEADKALKETSLQWKPPFTH